VDKIFDIIDGDKDGLVSKADFVSAMRRKVGGVDEYVMKRVDHLEFESPSKAPSNTAIQPRPRAAVDRHNTRVLIIGPGFGAQVNPRQGLMIEQAGFQVHWCQNVPNPERPNFDVTPYLNSLLAEFDYFRPHIVACASKGGVYIAALWKMNLWRGPTLLLNAHPSVRQIPQGIPVVLCHGANDEVYPTKRSDLEALIATGTKRLCFLYHTANSGQVAPGMFTREGDRHNMESLLLRNCLPRLLDALLCPDGPEAHLVRTWRDRLSMSRTMAESWLGYTPERLRRHWQSSGRMGRDANQLFDVHPGTEEFDNVIKLFKAMPREPPAYLLYPQQQWDRVGISRIQRVENGAQMEWCVHPYFQAVQRSFEDQQVEFEPGIHTTWGFHGASAEAIESIIMNPVAGFQPLASGSRSASVWGSGTYFARDAQYVAGSHFCGAPNIDGTCQMLLCLMITGLPCLGNPDNKGVLPVRQWPHRYNSSVDSLSSPEVYVIQHPSAAYPAYLLSFA